MKLATLRWHKYRYFPYERDLAHKEVTSLLAPRTVRDIEGGLEVETASAPDVLRKLVYFSCFSLDGIWEPTLQHLLEKSGSAKRQATRYSAHGLHEYKGKFNPQVVRGVLNYLGVPEGSRILDPFCGSGTTLVECTYAGFDSAGCDLNPLAVFVSLAKVQAISTPVRTLRNELRRVLDRFATAPPTSGNFSSTRQLNTQAYLEQWLPSDVLTVMDSLGSTIQSECTAGRDYFLAVVSDLIREYSLQDPADLRIRRRKSPLPTEPLLAAFESRALQLMDTLDEAQQAAGVLGRRAEAYVADSRDIRSAALSWAVKPPFQGAVTSPPYATALPYIDTQRLSLVWLGMAIPKQLRTLDAQITGSREFSRSEKGQWTQRLLENRDHLPNAAHELCTTMHGLMSPSDGFRRQAVPALLYRYLVSMKEMFNSVAQVLERGAPYALLVGHNRTTLGGQLIDIDTPALLALLAEGADWTVEDTVAFQTYQRYSLHRHNAVQNETLLVLRN